MHVIKGYKDEWRVQEYLLITFFISWLSWGILILLTTLRVVEFGSIVGICLFALGGFGPTISGLICLEGKVNWKKFCTFVFDHKKHTISYLLLFAVLEIIVIALSSGQINSGYTVWAIPLVYIVCTLFGGGNEELGWRGTMQPVMERLVGQKVKNQALNFVVTVLIIGVVWAVWHLPLWFVQGSTQQDIPFSLFMLATICQAFWLGCIYFKTHSVFFCMLFHGLSNVLLALFVIDVNWVLVLGFLLMVILSVVIVGYSRSEVIEKSSQKSSHKKLSRKEKR